MLEDDELSEQFAELRERAIAGEDLDELLPESFALTREVGRRTMAMRHFDVQMIGGMVLHDGQIAEMRTGEGKTLTATLAVVLNALPAKGVHVVTVNDYLARRDADWMRPIYEGLGLTVGVLQNNQPYEEKRAAYASRHHVRHELRVRLRLPARQHGDARWRRRSSTAAASTRTASRSAMHNFAIVDEVDNILIDEARTPLIISGAPEQAADLYERFAKLAPNLDAGQEARGHGPAREEGLHGGLRLRVRREAQDGLGHRAGRRRRPRSSSASSTSTAPRTAPWSTTCTRR